MDRDGQRDKVQKNTKVKTAKIMFWNKDKEKINELVQELF